MTNAQIIGISLKLCAALLAASALLFGQTTGAGTIGTSRASESAGPSVNSTAILSVSPEGGDTSFRGSVPQGQASSTPIALSLTDAITRGLKANLGLLTTQEASRQARAERIRALSALLPHVNGQIKAIEQQLNLQALGFLVNFPPGLGFSIPHIVGPYSYQSALANASISLFDYSAINNFKASKENLKASALSVKNARDLVVQAVGDAYLQIIADSARIVAVQAEIDAGSAIYTNALRRHDAGTAIGIDVLRSQVELKQRQQTLVAVSNQFEKDKLILGRVIGLPLGQVFTVADPSSALPLPAMSLSDALAKAYENRPDYQVAKSRVVAAEFSLRAARAERYPTLTANGYYGDEGLRLFTNSHGVFNVTGTLQFNIFDGGRIRADIQESDSDLQNRRNEMENLRGQIDYEVRSALLDLKSSEDQVDVARGNVDLASQSLKQSQDRFSAGVTNTVEVVQAQQAVADANESLISAQFQYNVAKVGLARSLGLAEENVRAYFNQKP